MVELSLRKRTAVITGTKLFNEGKRHQTNPVFKGSIALYLYWNCMCNAFFSKGWTRVS